MNFCGQCGTPRTGDPFCGGCGASLGAVVSSAPTSGQPAAQAADAVPTPPAGSQPGPTAPTTPASPVAAVEIQTHTLRMGRDPGNDVVLTDPSASRWHARIEGSPARITDLDTFRGTRVNDEHLGASRVLVTEEALSALTARARGERAADEAQPEEGDV